MKLAVPAAIAVAIAADAFPVDIEKQPVQLLLKTDQLQGVSARPLSLGGRQLVPLPGDAGNNLFPENLVIGFRHNEKAGKSG